MEENKTMEQEPEIQEEEVKAEDTAEAEAPRTISGIVCWGDDLINGEESNTYSYMAVLQKLLTDNGYNLTVINKTLQGGGTLSMMKMAGVSDETLQGYIAKHQQTANGAQLNVTETGIRDLTDEQTTRNDMDCVPVIFMGYYGGWNHDPAELAEKFKDLDTIVETAREVNEASGGKCKLFSGYDEIKRSLTGSRTQGFYDENDKITIDDNIKTYMDTAKTIYDEELTFNTDQWSADWSANMSGDGEESNAAVAYMGCPWFVYWCLTDSWKDNTILVPTQTKCYWGGTGLAATTDCADTELAAKIMKFFTCDEDGMVAINTLNSDYVNNTEAVSKIIDAGTSADGNGYLYPDAGQNFMEFFLPLADGLDASMVTAEDQQILSLMDTQTKAYATGEKDLDTAIADLTASIHDTFSYLSAE